MTEILRVEKVSKQFGGIRALNDINLYLNRGEIVGLLGPNGSGKTTLFNVICGVLRPDRGEILFMDRRIDKLPPHRIATLGISRTFQEIRLIDDLSVMENTMISALPHYDMDYRKSVKHAEEALKTVGIKSKLEFLVGDLNLYERKLVELARAISAKPKLMLVDEIMAGLTEEEQNTIARILNDLRDRFDITIFWIEHVIRAMFKLVNVDRIIVLNWGNKLAEGNPEQILNNTEVIEAYLGKSSIRGDEIAQSG